MQTVQIVISEPRYLGKLCQALHATGEWTMASLDSPDLSQNGVVVVDSYALERITRPFVFPERVVLVTFLKDPDHLSRAWEAGIQSVVLFSDPVSTAVLAIMAASLRAPKPCAVGAGWNSKPGPAGVV